MEQLHQEETPAAETAAVEEQPSGAHANYDRYLRWLDDLFTPDLLRDLLAQVPGLSLTQVRAALLFLGKDGDLFILNSREQGPKWLSRETVRAAFSLVPTDSGMLPPGTIRHGTGLSGEQWMAIYIPPARHTLHLAGVAPTLVTINIPLPAFVFAGRGSGYSIWAVKEPVIRPETIVYQAPLPNVSPDGGRICFGGANAPSVSNLTIMQAFHTFMEGSLYSASEVANCSRAYPQDVRYQLVEVSRARMRTYPYDDLVPITGYRGSLFTVEDVLHSYIIPR